MRACSVLASMRPLMLSSMGSAVASISSLLVDEEVVVLKNGPSVGATGLGVPNSFRGGSMIRLWDVCRRMSVTTHQETRCQCWQLTVVLVVGGGTKSGKPFGAEVIRGKDGEMVVSTDEGKTGAATGGGCSGTSLTGRLGCLMGFASRIGAGLGVCLGGAMGVRVMGGTSAIGIRAGGGVDCIGGAGGGLVGDGGAGGGGVGVGFTTAGGGSGEGLMT